MSTAEIGEELKKRVKLTAKDPRTSVRGVVSYNPVITSPARGSYVYTRTAVNGAAVRDRLRVTSIKGGYVAVGAELIGLLWPGFGYSEQPRDPRLTLDGGPEVTVPPATKRLSMSYSEGPYGILKLSAPFWTWWDARRAAGADEILVRCEDGEAGRYRVTAISRSELDPEAVRAASDTARTEAGEAMRGSDRGISIDMLVLRLLVRAPYAGQVPPDPLPALMLSPYPRFAMTDFGRIDYRPDLTPALARLFQDRILAPWIKEEQQLRTELKLSPETMPSHDRIVDDLAPDLNGWLLPAAPTATDVVQSIRLKVDLINLRGTSRTIDVRDDQTLLDVHNAIQDAFGWDNDHLWAFSFGPRHDPVTTVDLGDPWTGIVPPGPDDVTLAELELQPKQSFSYVFDFGDNWMHELKVEQIAPADGGSYPRVVASEGEDPEQYPSLDEDDYEDDEDADEDDGWYGEWGDVGVGVAGLGQALGSPFGFLPPAAVEGILDALGLEGTNFNDLSQFDLPPPDPTLRPLPIDLNLLVPAFELVPPGSLFLDTERGDLLIVLPGDAPESRVLRETLEGSPERYLRVPEATGERQYAAMLAFTETLPEGRLRTRLQAALAHPKGYDRWYQALERDAAAAERWNSETDLRVVSDTLAWLAEHGITPTPPAEPEPAPALLPETHPVSDARPRPAKKPTKPRPKIRKR